MLLRLRLRDRTVTFIAFRASTEERKKRLSGRVTVHSLGAQRWERLIEYIETKAEVTSSLSLWSGLVDLEWMIRRRRIGQQDLLLIGELIRAEGHRGRVISPIGYARSGIGVRTMAGTARSRVGICSDSWKAKGW
jgi:hypothetical protein